MWSWELNDGDALNAEIWAESPSVQRALQAPEELLLPEAIGAQQAMLEAGLCQGVDENTILQWVPDLVGGGWRDREAVLVVGSAYAGFIKELSRRSRSLPLADYKAAASAVDFQRMFVRSVVAPDSDYYHPLGELMDNVAGAHRWALFDLCRASFVRRHTDLRGRRRDQSNDGVPIEAPSIFSRYVESPMPAQWLWRRIADSQAQRIVALGKIAEHGLLRLFHRRRMVIQATDAHAPWVPGHHRGVFDPLEATLWPARYADNHRPLKHWCTTRTWWTITGNVDGVRRRWHLLPVIHPARRLNGPDPTYAITSTILREMPTG